MIAKREEREGEGERERESGTEWIIKIIKISLHLRVIFGAPQT